MISKYVTELRYIAVPEFIDNKGDMVRALASEHFPQWEVKINNVVEVKNDRNEAIFVGPNNLGFTTFDKDSVTICRDGVITAMNRLSFPDPIRWGTRMLSFRETRKSFNTLLKEYKQKLLQFKPSHFKSIKGSLIDVGVSYIFLKGKTRYHLTSGPMSKKQATDYFPDKDLPEKGIFIDIDIYKEKGDFQSDDNRRRKLNDFIDNAFKEGEEIITQFYKVING